MIKRESPHHVWRFNHKCRAISIGKLLRVEVLAPAMVRWTSDGGRTWTETATTGTQLGVHYADLPTAALLTGSTIGFTFFSPEANRWEESDFAVQVV